jgi:hypothetical protein
MPASIKRPSTTYISPSVTCFHALAVDLLGNYDYSSYLLVSSIILSVSFLLKNDLKTSTVSITCFAAP